MPCAVIGVSATHGDAYDLIGPLKCPEGFFEQREVLSSYKAINIGIQVLPNIEQSNFVGPF
jgi:hypothetical protein